MRRSDITWLLCSCLLIVIAQVSCQATVIYVADGGTGDGSSWPNAMGSIQDAIEAQDATEVRIKAYSDGVTEYNEHIQLREGVSVKGGYLGNGDARDIGPDPTYVTVISAAGTNDCVIAALSGITRATVVEHVTLRDGIGRLQVYRYGGGVFCSAASPTIQYCHILSNSARYGGGIYADINSCPGIMANTIIENNTGWWGGGIYWYQGTCLDSKIRCNTANAPGPAAGGGVYLGPYGATGTTFSHNEVSSNYALNDGSGGGVYMNSTSSLTVLSDNTITENHATGGIGGGICASDNCEITRNTISSNVA